MFDQGKTMKLLNILFSVSLLLLASCSAVTPQQTRDRATAPTFVLVHGAFQDKRAWDDVIPLLQKNGANVVAVDLPGRASAGDSVEGVTLDAHRDAVLRVIDQQSAPVILVGHSFGGITISNVAERAPEKVKTLVYVAAYLPVSGDSMAKLSEGDQWNKFNKVRQNFMVSADYKFANVLDEDQILLFCADCAATAKAKTKMLMQREPLAPAATPVTLTSEKFGKVDKVYVTTKNDNAVSYRLQQMMIEKTPMRKVITLDTGHSPFLEAPQQLADALIAIVSR
jgi:pimeloyl-ACP methyl ester carboxylesterase